jgi:hypothetical protein
MSRRQKYNLVTKKKAETKIADIVAGLPVELLQFYTYCRQGMEFYDCPDYSYLKFLLHSLIHKEAFNSLLCF